MALSSFHKEFIHYLVQKIAMCEHDSFRFPRGSTCVDQRGSVVWLDLIVCYFCSRPRVLSQSPSEPPIFVLVIAVGIYLQPLPMAKTEVNSHCIKVIQPYNLTANNKTIGNLNGWVFDEWPLLWHSRQLNAMIYTHLSWFRGYLYPSPQTPGTCEWGCLSGTSHWWKQQMTSPPTEAQQTSQLRGFLVTQARVSWKDQHCQSPTLHCTQKSKAEYL